MRFLCMFKPSKPEGSMPTEGEMSKMGAFIEESFKNGYLLATEGCLPSAMGARVRRSGSTMTVIDGPFAEAKELVGGFALIQAKSKADAVEFTKQFLAIAGDGETEIRQIFEA
jgi:hypothetical protein